MDIQKDFIQRLRGRAEFCRDRGEVKTPELLERAAKMLEEQQKKIDELSYSKFIKEKTIEQQEALIKFQSELLGLLK